MSSGIAWVLLVVVYVLQSCRSQPDTISRLPFRVSVVSLVLHFSPRRLWTFRHQVVLRKRCGYRGRTLLESRHLTLKVRGARVSGCEAAQEINVPPLAAAACYERAMKDRGMRARKSFLRPCLRLHLCAILAAELE